MITDKGAACEICGITEGLDLHHVDGAGPHLTENPNNYPGNLQVLCHKCHIRLHCGVIQKHQDIITRRKAGEKLQSIADFYGISRQRVFQILQKNKNQSCKTSRG